MDFSTNIDPFEKKTFLTIFCAFFFFSLGPKAHFRVGRHEDKEKRLLLLWS
jgi:hypothetical protein